MQLSSASENGRSLNSLMTLGLTWLAKLPRRCNPLWHLNIPVSRILELIYKTKMNCCLTKPFATVYVYTGGPESFHMYTTFIYSFMTICPGHTFLVDRIILNNSK